MFQPQNQKGGGKAMLERYYELPHKLKAMRRGPLAGHIDALAAKLSAQGYSRSMARVILCKAAAFSRFAQSKGITSAGELNLSLLDRFVEEELKPVGKYQGAANATRHVLVYLVEQGIIPPLESNSPPPSPVDIILARYDRYLVNVRGVSPGTSAAYLKVVRHFLECRQNDCLESISGAEIFEYLTSRFERCLYHKARRHICTSIRMFLRFLYWEGTLSIDLDRVIPRIYARKLATVPRHIPWQDVRKLIDSINTLIPQGLRDKAALLLLAMLGLRSGEVRNLKLKDIRWQKAEIYLPCTKTGRERVLPLPKEVGEALEEYILYGRPRIDSPYVFLSHRAPVGHFKTNGSIGEMVRRALKNAGIEAPFCGAHLLRHSLATHLVNSGVPIKEIADILGHAGIDSTAIYTKVDKTNLASVALPFPGGNP
jgi:site-specific recombinase XerD